MKASTNMLRRSKLAGFTLVEIMIVVLIIGILLAIAIPNFIQARESARSKSCIANLKQMDSAKQQWLMDNKANAFAAVTFTNGAPLVTTTTLANYMRSTPICPSGGTYTTGTEILNPACTLGVNTVNGVSYPHVLPA